MRTSPGGWTYLWAGSLLAVWLGAGCKSSTLTSAWQPRAPLPATNAPLAVVPFENLSSSRNAGLILTDLATTLLYACPQFRVVEISYLTDDREARLRRLEVTPWERQVGLNTATAAGVGQAAKTDWVLVGSVGEYGFVDGFGETATVGINLRLMHVESGEIGWAGSLSRRAACTAFSQESVHRLAHGVLRDLLGQMTLAMEQRRQANARSPVASGAPRVEPGTTNPPVVVAPASPDSARSPTNSSAPMFPDTPVNGEKPVTPPPGGVPTNAAPGALESGAQTGANPGSPVPGEGQTPAPAPVAPPGAGSGERPAEPRPGDGQTRPPAGADPAAPGAGK
jgi:hypothetical protein